MGRHGKLATNGRGPSGAGRRVAMTLLEVILALALSVLVLGAVTLAIHTFLRTLDARRSSVEETQIGRAVLRMIADDLHAAVQQEKLDFTQAGNQASSAGAVLADAASGAGAATGATGSTSGTGSGGATTGGAAGGSSSGGGATGGSTTGGASAGGATGSGTSAGGESASQNIDQASTVPPVPGIFGNQYQLQIDVSRIPRIDEMLMQQTSMDGSVVDLPSDMKTVAYYVRTTEAQPGTGFSAAAPGSTLGKQMNRPGLVRRQMDRAVTLYATQGGRTSDLARREQLVAPEVVGIEFRYFDGTQWVQAWDSIEQNRLPNAIEIIVAVQPGGEQVLGAMTSPGATAPGPSSAAAGAAQGPLLFRQLVRLPAARPCPATTDADGDGVPDSSSTSDSGASSDAGAGSSGSSGASGTGGTGASAGGATSGGAGGPSGAGGGGRTSGS